MTPTLTRPAAPATAPRHGRGEPVALVVSLAVALGCVLAMSPLEHRLRAASGGLGKLDFLFGYSAATVRLYLESYGPEGRALFWRLNGIDLVFPVAFAAVCLLGARMADSALGRPRRLALFAAPAAIFLLCDWGENAAFYLLLDGYPRLDSVVVAVASRLTQAKLLALALCWVGLVLTAGVGVSVLARRLRRAAPLGGA